MFQQGKSYRHGKSLAPYRKPVTATTNKGSSFLTKMKALFNQQMDAADLSSQHQSKEPRLNSQQDAHRTTSIPGGFFSPDSSATSLHLPKRPNSLRRNISTNELMEGINSCNDIDDESCAADTSNAKLADFFSRKGNEPLTDMEMEGVLSLMKKANNRGKSRMNSTANNSLSIRDSFGVESSPVLKSSRNPSMAASSFRPPSFIPNYDDSVGSRSMANASIRTTSSKRRVFDYSNLPSPYKTTVYKYSAADSRENSRVASSSPVALKGDAVGSMSSTMSNPKRLSNTASALVSILNSDSSKKQPVTELANPYSSHTTQIRKYKKTMHAPTSKQQILQSDPPKSSALQETENTKVKLSEPLPKSQPKIQQQSSLDKYKPMRSSSLRSTIVAVDDSPDKKDTENRTPILPTSHFTFSFKKDGGKVERTDKDQCVPTRNADEVFQFPSNGSKKCEAHVEPAQLSLGSRDKPTINSTVSGSQTNNETNQYVKPDKPDMNGINESKLRSLTYAAAKPEYTFTGESRKSGISDEFEFRAPLVSHVDSDMVDEKKVEEFKSMFVF